ncbi:hypothetical protein K9N68_37170 (plasmid) [Kovacikia minuta CCNUW1]|uniref:hypothetical protein n=1 Tax=Kovacikia minuta TaxID=2931930 RepID=UPI001CD01D64|nr:hypothetical protein [Kovacikia minuta]UBF29844.1 hypothetical protein K9N68_37170 [Kovacikia minuta CCNUW1]
MLTKQDILRLLHSTVRQNAYFILSGATAATAANYGNFFIAPMPLRVVSVQARFSAAGGSAAAVTVNKAATGTATDSGTAVLSAPIDLTGSADTTLNGVLSSVAGATVLNTGDALGAVDSGTLTNLANLILVVSMKPLEIGSHIDFGVPGSAPFV